MDITYSFQRGAPANVTTNLKQRISQYIRDCNEFRIGRTNSPEARMRQYVADGDAFIEMIVLYRTSTIRNAQIVESALIEYYWETPGFLGERTGGGPIGAGNYYVYLVVR